MTLGTAIGKVRRLCRTNSTGASDQEVMEKINEAQKEFAQNVHSLTREGYVTITPLFDLQTDFALRLTIVGGYNILAATDIAICVTDADDQTGSAVATALQVAIRAVVVAGGHGGAGPLALTVSWSTTTWEFTIDAQDATSITIDEPSAIGYASALDLLGFVNGTTASTSVTGSLPTDCTVESALPTDFLSIIGDPEWNGDRLSQGPFDMFKSPETTGTPEWYYIRNKNIMLYPPPTEQGILHFFYKFSPTEFTVVAGYEECGLSGKALDTATGLTASTAYTFRVNIDGGGLVQYTITTGTDVTYEPVIDLMNDQLKGAKFSLVAGDLRCTSNTIGASSAITLSATSSSGTNLFATLTGFTAHDAAVATQAGTDLYIDDEYAMAVVYFAASQIAEENFEPTVADRYFAQFKRKVTQFTVHRANNNPLMFPEAEKTKPFPEVQF